MTGEKPSGIPLISAQDAFYFAVSGHRDGHPPGAEFRLHDPCHRDLTAVALPPTENADPPVRPSLLENLLRVGEQKVSPFTTVQCSTTPKEWPHSAASRRTRSIKSTLPHCANAFSAALSHETLLDLHSSKDTRLSQSCSARDTSLRRAQTANIAV